MNGSSAPDALTASSNASRLSVTRNAAPAVDGAGVETLAFAPAGGADTTTINDVSTTGVTSIILGLGLAGGGDGAADTTIVDGTGGPDAIQAAAVGNLVQVTGSPTPINIASSEPASEGSNRPTSAITSPSRAKPARPARAASGSLPTIPITGVGKIGPAGASL